MVDIATLVERYEMKESQTKRTFGPKRRIRKNRTGCAVHIYIFVVHQTTLENAAGNVKAGVVATSQDALGEKK